MTPAAPDPEGFLYHHVVVVGHSLGSVVAYDLLNRLILDDNIVAYAGVGTSRAAAHRTPLLLTYGSPLQKLAFFSTVSADKAP